MARINYPLSSSGVYYLSGGLYGVPPVTETMLEDWESGNSNNWPSGNQNYDIQQDGTLFDTYNAVSSPGTNFCSLYSFPGDGLPQYWPRSSGKKLVYYTYTPSSTTISLGMYFGAVDTSNNYFTREKGDGEVQLVEKVGGSNNTLNGVVMSPPEDTILRWELEWYDGSGSNSAGDMTLSLYNDETATFIDDVSASSTSVETNTGSNGEGLGIWKTGDDGFRIDDIKLV